jgi:hypothetical protein
MTATLAAELEKLSTAEKLLLVEALWNDIAKESDSMEPPAWHDQVLAKDAAAYDREVIASRLADYRAGKTTPPIASRAYAQTIGVI